MSNYVKATNFTTKDTLPSGDTNKVVKGTELDNEFNSIAGAISSKADTASPTFTGTPAAPTAALNTNTTQLATTAFVVAEAADAASDAITAERSATATLTNKTINNSTVAYSNANTGLVSTTVQTAISELCTLPAKAKTASYTLQKTDIGAHVSITTGDITVPPDVFAVGDVVVIYNNSSSSRNILRGTGVVAYWYNGVDANRVLLQRGLATLVCVGANTFVVSGQGVT